MNSLGILITATIITLALACRGFALEASRERRKSVRGERENARLYEALDYATDVIAEQSREIAQLRHPSNHRSVRPALTIIDGGA